MSHTINKIIEKRIEKIIEGTVFSSPDGTTKTLSSDQKKKVQAAADNGEEVVVKKKGAPVKEEEELDENWKNYITGGLLSLITIAGGTKIYQWNKNHEKAIQSAQKVIEVFNNPLMKMSVSQIIDLHDDIEKEVGNIKTWTISRNTDQPSDETLKKLLIKDILKIIYKKPEWFGIDQRDGRVVWLGKKIDNKDDNNIKNDKTIKEEDGGGGESATGEPGEDGAQNDTIQHLYNLGLGYAGRLSGKKKKLQEGEQNSSTKRASKFLENAEKYLVKVNEELKKAIEYEERLMAEAEELDNKETEKFSSQVRSELGKILKDKFMVDAAMKKYEPVMKHVKGEHDPKKIARSVLSTALKVKKAPQDQ